jgi:RimJ/RimL family protein N-acetyltransferase
MPALRFASRNRRRGSPVCGTSLPALTPAMNYAVVAPHIRLRLITEEDAGFVLALRQDRSRSRFLHAIENDLSTQQAWIRGSLARTAQNTEFYWVVETRGEASARPVGLVRLSDVNAESFVFGSWVMAPEAPVPAGIESYLAACDFGFGALGCRRYFAEVRLENDRALAFHQRVGGVDQGVSPECRRFEQTRDRYLHFRRRYRRYVLDDGLPPRVVPRCGTTLG